MKHTAGRILAVQERRFRLLTPAGQVYLFTLAGKAAPSESWLAELRDANVEVEVEFSGAPNVVGGVAHAVHQGAR